MNKDRLKIIAPAKVNLFLAVGPRQADSTKNYHDVINIMHTLLLKDIVYMESSPVASSGKGLEIHVEFLDAPKSKVTPFSDSGGQEEGKAPVDVPNIKEEDNIAYKAVKKFAEILGRTKSERIDVLIEKNIPHQAGLGGGSADAAAAIVGAAKLWGISEDDRRLVTAAQAVGADVSFFMNGGCALYLGAGEKFDHKIMPVNREVVIVKPQADSYGATNDGLSTKAVYERFDQIPGLAADFYSEFPCNDPSTDSAHEEHDCGCGCEHEHHHEDGFDRHEDYCCDADVSHMNLVDAAKSVVYADGLSLFNNLAVASESLMPELVEARHWLSDVVGPENVLLCGSGSATFAIMPDDKDSEEIVAEARKNGWWAVATQLANVKARIIPQLEVK